MLCRLLGVRGYYFPKYFTVTKLSIKKESKRDKFFYKIPINHQKPFFSEGHDEIKIVPHVFTSFNCPLPAGFGFISLYFYHDILS